MKFKISKGGTAKGDENLCKSCRYATRRRAAFTNEETIRCKADDDRLMPGPIAECSDYSNASQPSLAAMQQIAWTVSPDKRAAQAGFMVLSPADAEKAIEKGKLKDLRREPLVLPDGSVEW